ncbi:MAG: hypothetical protein WEB06_11010 [Actinomycetota bacterium]
MRASRGTDGNRLAAGGDVLGAKAAWGRVGYAGEAFAPARGTYLIGDAMELGYTTVQDSGRHPRRGPELANLDPLVAAALYEGFAAEAGPLSTWSN